MKKQYKKVRASKTGVALYGRAMIRENKHSRLRNDRFFWYIYDMLTTRGSKNINNNIEDIIINTKQLAKYRTLVINNEKAI